MIFDIQTRAKAMKTAASLVGEASVECATVEDYAASLRKQPYEIQCRHLTSSLNCCSDIGSRGLMSWGKLLVEDTELKRQLNSVGIEYSHEDGFSISGLSFARLGVSDPTLCLRKDDCISAYLFCGSDGEGYAGSPEIFRRMQMTFRGNDSIRQMVETWERNATSYCVSYGVKPDEVDVITGFYSADEGIDIETALAEVLIDVLNLPSKLACCTHIPIILYRGIEISPSRLQIHRIDELEWDWANR